MCFLHSLPCRGSLCSGTATAAEIAEHLGLAQRTVVGLCRAWLKSEFFELKIPSRRNRSYRPGKAFAFLIEYVAGAKTRQLERYG